MLPGAPFLGCQEIQKNLYYFRTVLKYKLFTKHPNYYKNICLHVFTQGILSPSLIFN